MTTSNKAMGAIGAGLQGFGKGLTGDPTPIFSPQKPDPGAGDMIKKGTAQSADMSDTGDYTAEQQARAAGVPIDGSRKRGGRINKTGIYRLHKDEYVLNSKTVKRLDRMRGKIRKSVRKVSGR